MVASVGISSILLSLAASTRGTVTATAFLHPSVAAKIERAVASAVAMSSTSTSTTAGASSNSKSRMYVPSERDEHYGDNIARYLLDLNEEVASSPHDPSRQPIVRPASQSLMNRVPDYERSSHADNIYADPYGTRTTTTSTSAVDGVVVPSGKGADSAWDGRAVDDQGWSNEEIATYDGWRSDRVRQWRNARTYAAEGFDRFSEVFGDKAYGLNHRFFLHYDDRGRMWLCAEDGCEGTPSEGGRGLMGKIGGMLFGR
ncbi:hypothetical protein ACHAW5_002856 [Stephanodiscus triporus]|uniref:Uncharacterized protein n=1 Tax=Stephanodiscus triporus TaxID=2934178 RepID=A0ABD3Q1S6_9STRA